MVLLHFWKTKNAAYLSGLTQVEWINGTIKRSGVHNHHDDVQITKTSDHLPQRLTSPSSRKPG
jgi:hypothetical protein